MIERFFVPAHGPDREALAIAVTAAIALAEKHNCEITLLVPALKNASNTILTDILQEKSVKKLVKGETVKINGHTTKMKSTVNFQPYSEHGLIVALWATKKSVQKMEEADRSKAPESVSKILRIGFPPPNGAKSRLVTLRSLKNGSLRAFRSSDL
jgi:hypothetical protein